MDKIKFVLRNPEILQRCIDKIEEMFFEPRSENDIEVILQEHKTHRSTDQNNRYWMLLRKFSEETGHTADELHQYFKHDILGVETIKSPITDEEYETTKGTSSLNVDEFLQYMQRVEQHMAEYGVVVPEADYG